MHGMYVWGLLKCKGIYELFAFSDITLIKYYVNRMVNLKFQFSYYSRVICAVAEIYWIQTINILNIFNCHHWKLHTIWTCGEWRDVVLSCFDTLLGFLKNQNDSSKALSKRINRKKSANHLFTYCCHRTLKCKTLLLLWRK